MIGKTEAALRKELVTLSEEMVAKKRPLTVNYVGGHITWSVTCPIEEGSRCNCVEVKEDGTKIRTNVPVYVIPAYIVEKFINEMEAALK